MVIKKYLILFSLILTSQLTVTPQTLEYDLEKSGFTRNFEEGDKIDFTILGSPNLRITNEKVNSISFDGYYLSQFTYLPVTSHLQGPTPLPDSSKQNNYSFWLSWKRKESYSQDNELSKFFKNAKDTTSLQGILNHMLTNKLFDADPGGNIKKRAMKAWLLLNKETIIVQFSCDDVGEIEENLLEKHKLEHLVPSE